MGRKTKTKSKNSSNNDDDDNNNDNNENENNENENEKSLKILSKKVLRIQKNYITSTTKSFIQNNGVVALSSVY